MLGSISVLMSFCFLGFFTSSAVAVTSPVTVKCLSLGKNSLFIKHVNSTTKTTYYTTDTTKTSFTDSAGINWKVNTPIPIGRVSTTDGNTTFSWTTSAVKCKYLVGTSSSLIIESTNIAVKSCSVMGADGTCNL